jgi:3-phenylpropionate/trans-cinnamate dioxygenase ferredoxin reductase subunit
MSRRFKVKHEGSGTCILTQAHSVAVHKDALSLNDGTDIPADLILLAAGVRPNIELAEAAGLECNNGIVVNSRFQTCDPAISAIGDCASFPDPRSGKRVRLESVQGATDQARAVARRLTRDHSDDYCAVPWFWSDQADWKLQIAGLAEPSDDSHLREDGAVFRFRDGQLTAVETVNDARTHMTARRLLARTRPPSRQQLVDAAFDLGAEVR